MARIFISYRREDSEIWVSRLVDELRKHFPSDQVFQDVSSIDPGADFVDVLDKALATAGVMLAVIGRGWLSATDRQGRRRLDLAGDFVRQEIAESLRRPGVRVFPLLVNGAEMPSEEELPEPLKSLYRRHAFELTVRHWNNDVAQLVQSLKRVPGLSDNRREEEADTRETTPQEAERREAEERAAQEEAQRRAAQEEHAQRKAAEEEARRTAAEEARRKGEEESKRREAEERAAQEEAQRRAAQEEHAQRKAAEEEARRTAAEEARRKGEEESKRREAEERAAQEEAQRKAAQERAKSSADEEARRKAEDEERRSGKAEEEEVRRRAAVEEAQRPVFRDGDDFPEMVVIPAGEFMMGSPDGEAGRLEREGPQHQVTIARPFAVGRYAVTVAEFGRFVAATKYKTEAERNPDEGVWTWNASKSEWGQSKGKSWRDPGFAQAENHPVVGVSWNDALAYTKWLSEKTGKVYRLPSEAEWEYAARAGTTTRFPWGDEPGSNRANLHSGSPWSGKQTSPVGSFEPNAFGLYDMIGNVWEWVKDCWNDSYNGAPTDGSAWESGKCGQRVVRGGSWYFIPENARVAFRGRGVPGIRDIYLGFRLARTL